MSKYGLEQIALSAYKMMFRQAPDFCKQEQTFYGWLVFLASPKGKVVVKFSREVGRLAKEIEGLERLRKALPCKVPQVFFFGREEGHEYLMLEWVEGIPGHQLPDTPAATKAFSHSFIEVMLNLHEYTSASGFEVAQQHYESDFAPAYDHWMEPVYRYVMSEVSPFSLSLKSALHDIWQHRHVTLSGISSTPSLTHDDCHIGNVMFDATTFQVSAILDPCDVGYKHRELDIFHLDDVRPELELSTLYRQAVELPDGFELRRAFFSLWDDAKHSRNMGWYDEAWLQKKVDVFRAIEL